MNKSNNLTQRVLKLMDSKPHERSAREIARTLDVSYYDINSIVKTLVDLKLLYLTRKSGKAQNYCKPDYWSDVMGENVPPPE